MTLITSFSAFGGVAICADSQETVADYAKRKVNKILEFACDTGTYAIAGSGPGPYVDMVSQKICRAVEKIGDIDEVGDAIAKVLLEYYEQHVWPSGDRAEQSDIEMVVVAQPEQFPAAWLFHTYKTAVNRTEQFSNIGVGRYLADYLFDHLLSPSGDVYHMLAVAVYVHKEVRENIEGVGKETNVILYRSGTSKPLFLWPHQVREMEEITAGFDAVIKRQFHDLTHFGIDSIKKEQWNPDSFREPLDRIRSRMEQFVKDHENTKGWRKAFDEPWHGIVG